MHGLSPPGGAALLSSVPSCMPASGRRWTPLALTLGLHLLLVLGWMGGARRDAVDALRAAPPMVSTLVLVQPLPRPAPAPPAPAARPRPRPSMPARVPAPAPVPRLAPDSTSAVQAEPADSVLPAEAAPIPSPGALPGDLLATSKRMAGSVDRALHHSSNPGSSPITAEPDRKWERFADAVAGARVAAGGAVTLDSYTAGDGVIIYRKTVGDRVRCYASGSVGGTVIGVPGRASRADGRSAGSVSCPAGVSWTRH